MLRMITSGWALELVRAEGDLDAVELRHPDVENHHVRLNFFTQPEGREAVLCLGGDGETGPVEQAADAAANDGMVVGKQDAHGSDLALYPTPPECRPPIR